MRQRLAGWVQRFPALTAVLLGLLQVLAFPPFDLWWLGLLALTGLFLLFDDGGAGRAARVGFGFGTGLVAGGTYWLYTAIHDFGRAPVWLALFLMAGLVALMAAVQISGWVKDRLTTPLVGDILLLPTAVGAAMATKVWLMGLFRSP